MKIPSIAKERPEERKERIAHWQCTRTRVVESKKLYNRKKLKKVQAED